MAQDEQNLQKDNLNAKEAANNATFVRREQRRLEAATELLDLLNKDDARVKRLKSRVEDLRAELKGVEADPETTKAAQILADHFAEIRDIQNAISSLREKLKEAPKTDTGADAEQALLKLETVKQKLHGLADFVGRLDSSALARTWEELDGRLNAVEIGAQGADRNLEEIEKVIEVFADRIEVLKYFVGKLDEYDLQLIAFDGALDNLGQPALRQKRTDLESRLQGIRNDLALADTDALAKRIVEAAYAVGAFGGEVLQEAEKKPVSAPETAEPTGANAATEAVRQNYPLLPWQYSKTLRNFFVQDLRANRAYQVLYVDNKTNEIEVGVRDAAGQWVHVPVEPDDSIDAVRERVNRALASQDEGEWSEDATLLEPPEVPSDADDEPDVDGFVADAGRRLHEVHEAERQVAEHADMVPDDLPLADDADVEEVGKTEVKTMSTDEIIKKFGAETLGDLYTLFYQQMDKKDGAKIEVDVRGEIRALLQEYGNDAGDLVCDALELARNKGARLGRVKDKVEYMSAYMAAALTEKQAAGTVKPELAPLRVHADARRGLYETALGEINKDNVNSRKEVLRRECDYLAAELSLQNATHAEEAAAVDAVAESFFARGEEIDQKNVKEIKEAAFLSARAKKRLAAAVLVAGSVSLAALAGKEAANWKPDWSEVQKQAKKAGRWLREKVGGYVDEDTVRREREPEIVPEPSPAEPESSAIDTLTIAPKEYAAAFLAWRKTRIDPVRAVGDEAAFVKRAIANKVMDFLQKPEQAGGMSLVLLQKIDTSGKTRAQVVNEAAPQLMENVLSTLKEKGRLQPEEKVFLSVMERGVSVLPGSPAIKAVVEGETYFAIAPGRFGKNNEGQLVVQEPGKTAVPVVPVVEGRAVLFYPGEPEIREYAPGQPRTLVPKTDVEPILQVNLASAS